MTMGLVFESKVYFTNISAANQEEFGPSGKDYIHNQQSHANLGLKAITTYIVKSIHYNDNVRGTGTVDRGSRQVFQILKDIVNGTLVISQISVKY